MQFSISVVVYIVLAVFISLAIIYLRVVQLNNRQAKNTFMPDEPYGQDTVIQEYVKKRTSAGKGVEKEMAVIKAALISDPYYAWSWYSNLVMSFVDEGCSKPVAMMGAARFLNIFAQVDVKEDVRFIEEYARLTKTPV